MTIRTVIIFQLTSTECVVRFLGTQSGPTEFLLPELKCLELSKKKSFKSVEENLMIHKGLFFLCCQWSHLSSICALSNLKNTNQAQRRYFRQSKPHTYTASTANFIKKISVCQLNCHHFIDFSAYPQKISSFIMALEIIYCQVNAESLATPVLLGTPAALP